MVVGGLNLSRKYAELSDTLRNINKNIAERLLAVLESSGSEIIRAEHLMSGGQKVALESVLIISEPMKKSIKAFLDNIRTIASHDKMSTGSQFYVADYGGSKTQFIELLKNYIVTFKERKEPPFDRIITVVFNGSIDLTASYLGEKIEHDTATLLTRQLEIFQKDPLVEVDPNAFNNFMNLLLDFRKVKTAPEHLEEIHKLLMDLERVAGTAQGIRMLIEKVRAEISQLPVIDEERLLKIVLDIMMYASKYSITYLFLFDECDDWLSKIEEDSKWDPNFLKRQYFFRKLYDHIPNLRMYQIYFFTPRVHEALRSEKSDAAPGIQRIASDIIKASPSSAYIQVREQGVYQGEEAIEAVLKWLIILEKAIQPADRDIFNSFIPILIEKIDNKLSRRKANSTIISAIRAFIQLSEDIKHGQSQYDMAARNPTQYITIGKMIEQSFSGYLNFLNFNYSKKHVDVGGGKLIDGQFMSSSSGDTELYAELKSLKEPALFKLEKVEQVLNCLENLHSKVILFLFCPGLTESYVKEELYKWKHMGLISSQINLEEIIFIVISDQTLLNCLVGFERVPSSQLNEKLENFDKLLRLMNRDFHGKLLSLFPTAEEVPPAPREPPTVAELPSVLTPPQPPPPTPEPTPVLEESYLQLLQKLTSITHTTMRTAVEIVTILGTKQKVYQQRKQSVIKNAIRSPLLKNSFDDGVEFLKQHHIIQELSDTLRFNWDVFDKEDIKADPEGLMVQIFKALLNAKPSGG